MIIIVFIYAVYFSKKWTVFDSFQGVRRESSSGLSRSGLQQELPPPGYLPSYPTTAFGIYCLRRARSMGGPPSKGLLAPPMERACNPEARTTARSPYFFRTASNAS